MGQATTQWDGQILAIDMDWIDMGLRTLELPLTLFNRAPPMIVPVLVEEVLQYFANNQKASTMPVVPAVQATFGTEKHFVLLSTFLSHFLPSYFLLERRSPKAILQVIVPVNMEQDFLPECKPLVY